MFFHFQLLYLIIETFNLSLKKALLILKILRRLPIHILSALCLRLTVILRHQALNCIILLIVLLLELLDLFRIGVLKLLDLPNKLLNLVLDINKLLLSLVLRNFELLLVEFPLLLEV